MRNFLLDFERRRGEVRKYLAVLLYAERRYGGSASSAPDEALKIFRAGALLVIYNAVEASARLGVLAIYDEISLKGTTFDDLRESFRVRILHDFKNVSGDKYKHFQSIAVDMIEKSIDSQRLFSGNVDARKVRDAGDIYGFPTTSDFQSTKNGRDLLTVKSRRQDLAHGNLSFSEVGKEYTTTEIVEIAKYSLAYMSAVLRHIDTYLDAEGYRQSPTQPPPAPPPAPPTPVIDTWLLRARGWWFRLLGRA